MRCHFLSTLFSTALILGNSPVLSADLRNLQILENDTGTRAILELDGSTSYKLFTLQNPERLVLDLTGARLASGYRDPAPNGAIANVRTGKPTPEVLRVVFDLGKSVSANARLEQESSRTRLIVELPSNASTLSAMDASINALATTPSVRADVPQPVALVSSSPVTASSLPAPVISNRPTPAKTIQDVIGPGQRELIVAIDAGHGGKDPGAHGPTGVNEKNITLEVARELARQIEADPGMKAVLIRNGDVFVPLQDRYMKARTAQADLFISIHADASPNQKASGASVFVLSTRGASSQAARWLADQENAADLVGGVSLDHKDPHLAAVLLDLSQSATMRASDDVADQVLVALKGVGKAHKSDIERANFVVLRSPDVPSMLIETGFITNPQEEKRLADSDYRGRLASAIATGVRQYFTDQPPPGTWYAARLNQSDGVSQHVVNRGETLTMIAAQHGVTVNTLRTANNKLSDNVRVGERLSIPLPQIAVTPE